MNVAFIVENGEKGKFQMSGGLNFDSTLCVYNTKSHQISWISMDQLKQRGSNIALLLFDMGVRRVVANHFDMFSLQELRQFELTVYKTDCCDLVENIKRYNQKRLPEFQANQHHAAAVNRFC